MSTDCPRSPVLSPRSREAGPDSAVVSALYVGTLRHRRFHPTRHAFNYRVFMALMDIDEVVELCRVSRFLSHNRWNWASFDERDHVGDPALPLRERLRTDASAAGVALPEGRIFLLTNLRYLGYCFNPVSYYYCYDADRLALVMAEVHNTFGERHTYWMTPQMAEPGRPHSYRVPKTFHVSPFMSMSCQYRFAFSPPADRLDVSVAEWDDGRFFFDAHLRLERRPWSARELARVLALHPWMTLKVIAAIHWEALLLWLKRVPVCTHPKKLKGRAPVS